MKYDKSNPGRGALSSEDVMNPAHDEMARVEELLSRVRKLPAKDRDGFLVSSCGNDEELLRELRSLLAAADSMGEDFLEEPILNLGETSGELSIGDKIGHYQILREIGSGGMGRVYLTARSDAVYQQEVAIKVLKRGLDTDEIVRRFHHERKVLARLEHPHIVRILDGGATDDGRPYLVMEHVVGEPIHTYAKVHQLSLRARLELFREVCAAVAFAHQNLVVHRDLKPQNILVDHRGSPKLLDFGIAKLLAPGQEEFTLMGLQPLTPHYASPEQIANRAINTVSDVYSLGCLLYKLLAGVGPYDDIEPGEELYQKILGEEPKPPSSNPKCRHLAGDLDSIVLEALAKEPQQRYGSVEQLSEDIGRYLEGEPVRARRGTALYRVGKFVWRNRVGVSVTVGVLVALLSFGSWMRTLRDRAIQERESAQQSEAHAEEVVDFLIRVFENPNPEVSKGEEVTARQLLDENVATIRVEFEDQPEFKAELVSAMGRAYFGLGLYDQAGALLEESLRLRRAHPDTDPQDIAANLLTLAEHRKENDRFAEAIDFGWQALDVLRRPEMDRSSLARGLNSQAVLLKKEGDLKAAERLYRESLAMKLQLLGPRHEDVATSQHNLAAVLRAEGKYDEGEALYRETLQLRAERFGEDSPAATSTRKGLALLLMDRGDPMESVSILRGILKTRQGIYGREHPRVGTVHYNLGTGLRLLGNLEEAEAEFLQAIQIFTKRLKVNHSKIAEVQRQQALLWLAQGRLDEAERVARKALEIFQEAGPYGEIAEAESVLGACLLAQGSSERAEPFLRRGYRSLKVNRGEASRQTREALERLERMEAEGLRGEGRAMWVENGG